MKKNQIEKRIKQCIAERIEFRFEEFYKEFVKKFNIPFSGEFSKPTERNKMLTDLNVKELYARIGKSTMGDISFEVGFQECTNDDVDRITKRNLKEFGYRFYIGDMMVELW